MLRALRTPCNGCGSTFPEWEASPGHVQSARVLLTLKTALREALPLQLRSPERQDWRVGCGRSGDSGSAVVPGHHAMQRKRFNHGNLEKLLVDLAERFPPSQEEVAVVLREEMELWHLGKFRAFGLGRLSQATTSSSTVQ